MITNANVKIEHHMPCAHIWTKILRSDLNFFKEKKSEKE